MTELSQNAETENQNDEETYDISEFEEQETLSKEITITIDSIENVDPCSVEKILFKIEFDGRVLSQSEEIAIERSRVNIGLTAVIALEEVNSEFLDKILANPVLFTVIDCTKPPPAATAPPSAKEKEGKKKTKSTATPKSIKKGQKLAENFQNILGICNLDIGALATGSKRIKETITLEEEKRIVTGSPIVFLPRIVVVASTGEESLIAESENKKNNVLGVTVESVYNLPKYIKEGSVFNASISVPRFGDKSNNVVFRNGLVRFLEEGSYRKKWVSLQHIEGNGNKSKYFLDPDAKNIIHDLPGCIDMEQNIKKLGIQINWDAWRNSYLEKSDVNYLFLKIMKHRVWPIEIYLLENPVLPKVDKKTKTAVNNSPPPNYFHFMAFLNLSTLLYPGVTKVRVAAQLYTYSKIDLLEKFGIKQPTVDPIPAPAAPPVATSRASKASKSTKTPKTSKTSKVSAVEIEEKNDTPGVPVFDENGKPTFVVVEIELLRPFIPKRDPEFLQEKLQNYMSLKVKPDKKAMTLALAQENFSATIKTIVRKIVEEHQNFIRINAANNVVPENFDLEFNEFLCNQENFRKIESSLETKTIELITEKYGELSQYNAKIPEIYVYLVEEMHRVTNSSGLESRTTGYHFKLNDLQLFAEEAFEEGEFELARKYLLLKLSHQPGNPDYWLDYAVFCLQINENESALEAAREALSFNPNNQIGLLFYGLLMGKLNKTDIGELTLQVLLAKYPSFIEGWICLRLLYISVNNHEGGDVAYQMAVRLERENRNYESKKPVGDKSEFSCLKFRPEKTFKDLSGFGKYGVASYADGKSLTEPLSWSTWFCPPDNVYVKTLVLLNRLGFYEYSSVALSQAILSDVTAFSMYYLAVNHYLTGRFEEAVSHLELFVQEYGKDCFIWELMGHCYYKIGNDASAIACYEYVIESFNRNDDIHLVYLRMGYYYLKVNKFFCAKQVFVVGCKYSPSPKLWKGAGIAFFRLGELENAEISLSEANYLDSDDAETWGYLALTNASLRRIELFKNCYLEAQKKNLTNKALIKEIGSCIILNSMEDEGRIMIHQSE